MTARDPCGIFRPAAAQGPTASSAAFGAVGLCPFLESEAIQLADADTPAQESPGGEEAAQEATPETSSPPASEETASPVQQTDQPSEGAARTAEAPQRARETGTGSAERPRRSGRPSGGRGRDDRRRGGRGRGGRGKRRKVCRFCAERGAVMIDYKNVNVLRQFLDERARIKKARQTGTCRKHQRKLTRAVKRAREMALLQYTAD